VDFEAVVHGLFHQRVAVGDEENFLRLTRLEEEINQAHDCACLARAGGHDEQSAALPLVERLANAPDGFVLVGAVNDGILDRAARKWLAVLANEQEPLQICGGEKSSDEPGMNKADFPKVSVQPLDMKPNGAKSCFFAISSTYCRSCSSPSRGFREVRLASTTLSAGPDGR
jgi:hypothetical protein